MMNICHTYLLSVKGMYIWARLIFGLLIIRLDIVSLRYAYYVHLLLASYHYLLVYFDFSGVRMTFLFRLGKG